MQCSHTTSHTSDLMQQNHICAEDCGKVFWKTVNHYIDENKLVIGKLVHQQN